MVHVVIDIYVSLWQQSELQPQNNKNDLEVK